MAPKWDNWNNQRKLISHFTKHWIRLTGWLIRRPKIALVVQIRNQERHRCKERPWKLPKESELNSWAVATLLKAVCCFLQLSQGLKMGNCSFEKFLLNNPGLLKSISSSVENLVRLKILRLIIVDLWFWCSIQFRYKWEVYWLSTEGCSFKMSPNYSMLLIDWNIFIGVINRN